MISYGQLKKEIKEMQDQIEKMKNCNNCKHELMMYGENECQKFCSIRYSEEETNYWELKE